MSGPGGIVSMVKASPTSPDAAMQNQGSPCRHALGTYRATALQVGCRGTLAAAFVGAILSIELTSIAYRSRLSDRRGLRLRGGPSRLSSRRESALADPIDHRDSAGSLHWGRCLCAPYWYRRQCASVADWAASRAAIGVGESSRFIDFA